MDTVNTELIRGHVDTIILNSLVERDRYGYEILDIISNLSEGRYEIKQPTLYSCLKRLEKQGFISSYFGDETQGGRRRYYTLTEKGRDTLEQDQREWEFSRTIINRLLSDKEIDLKTVEAPFDPSELRPLTRRVRAYDSDEAAAAEQKAAASSMQENINAVSDQNAAVENKVEVESAKENVISVVAAAEAPTAPAAETAVQSTADKNGLGESVQPIRKPDIETLRKQTEASKFLKIGEFAEPTLLIPEENNVTKYTLSRDEEPVRREQPEQASAASVAPAASVRREDFFQPVADEAFATKPSEKPLPPTPGQVYAPHAAHDDKQETGINYREALSAVYESAEHAHNTTEVFDTNPDPSEGHAMLFGDLRQNITPYRGVRDWKVVEDTIYTLNQNYRNTNQIVDFVSSELKIDMQSIGCDGSEIVTLQPRKVSGWLAPVKGLKAVITTEARLGEFARKNYNILRETGRISKSKINLMTVYESKGLEFTAVAVADADMTDNERYIAYTRALKELAVVR